MTLSEKEGKYFKFLWWRYHKKEHQIQKNQNEEIELPEDVVLPIRIMEECIDFTYPAFDNLTELFFKNYILVPLNEMIIKINSTCTEHFLKCCQ